MKAAAIRAPLRRTQRIVGQVAGFEYIVAPTTGALPWVAEEWRAGRRVRHRHYATEEAADRRVDRWMDNRALMERNPL